MRKLLMLPMIALLVSVAGAPVVEGSNRSNYWAQKCAGEEPGLYCFGYITGFVFGLVGTTIPMVLERAVPTRSLPPAFF